MRRGVDYSWGRPSPAALVAAGFTFAVRYLSSWAPHAGKCLTLVEARALSAAGLDVVLVYEDLAGDFLVDPEATGRAHAAAARAQAATLGAPPDVPIYFAIDRDPRPAATLRAGLTYLRYAAGELGPARVGVYGGHAIVQAALDGGSCRYGWQTYAWSSGVWDERAQLRQVLNTQTLDGAAVDFDEAYGTDFGAWRVGQSTYQEVSMRVTGIPYIQGRNSYADPDGTKYAVAVHNTSNNATAEAEASYAKTRTDGVSSHFYVDSDSVIQSLDTAARAGHAGSVEGNNHAVAVEITGFNAWTRQQWLDNVAWDLLGRVLAQVCAFYGIAVRRARVAEMRGDPKVKAFYSHDDMRQAWGGTTHTDPGPNFPWDRLFSAVNAALSGPTTEEDMDGKQEWMLLGGDMSPGVNKVPNLAHARLRTIQDANDDAAYKAVPALPRQAYGLKQLGDMLAAVLRQQGVAQADIDDIQARTGTVVITAEQLDALAARVDAAGSLTAAEFRAIVDEELDEAFTGADPRGVDDDDAPAVTPGP